jgi:hypothetical protein
MRAGGPVGPHRDEPGTRDLAYRVLAAAVTLMRPGRRDWGLAMLAELGQVRHPGERAWFALGAARVALFPPRATRPWRAVSLGLVVRAVAAAAVIHALAPGAGLAAAALTALPAAGVWSTLTVPALAGRPRGAVLAAQVTVVAGVAGCLALLLMLVQHYPQVMTGGDHGWGAGAAFNVAAAGYLGLACLLARRPAATPRNSLYAMAAALVLAAGAAQYIARPSLAGLWLGPVPGNSGYWLSCLALPAVAALASMRRGRVRDGLETAAWATLLAGLITSIMMAAATYRAAPAADGSQPIIADARLHGMTSASAWLVSDNLGGAITLLILAPGIFLILAAAGAMLGRALSPSLVRPK